MHKCAIRFARNEYAGLIQHLFPGDGDEHGAVVLASYVSGGAQPTFLVREVHVAREGTDYVAGTVGYRALHPKFIHRMITRARDEKLAYLAVHNHHSDRAVAFSKIDLMSHERGYPALLQIAKGMPVGALVFGQRSIQADVWMPGGLRLDLSCATIVGSTIQDVLPSPRLSMVTKAEEHDRQIRMFGEAGQIRLREARIAIIGLGGVGSLVAQHLAHLGIRNFILIDDDVVEISNLSRIVGATSEDTERRTRKVDVAKRMILRINPDAEVSALPLDVSDPRAAQSLTQCDYLFLAADSMRARLIVNAIVHQYLVPAVQLGSKISATADGSLMDVMGANRPLRPGAGCLWCNQLIDPTALAIESKTDEERKRQAYGTQEPNPSVITLNAVSAAHAVNDFLLDYLALRPEAELAYEHFHFLNRKRALVTPRLDKDCSECGRGGLRFARGSTVGLPCSELVSEVGDAETNRC